MPKMHTNNKRSSFTKSTKQKDYVKKNTHYEIVKEARYGPYVNSFQKEQHEYGV